ncbi:MAG: xylulose 5-phosphate 3-epimerase [Hyphomicrobiaceae bacterium]
MREADPQFAVWAQGFGVIAHDALTQVRVNELARMLATEDEIFDISDFFNVLSAADRLTSAALNLVVHMTYARRVRTDGVPLQAEDFKMSPEGHVGGSLNMVPAYVGYLAANLLSAFTRGWVMGQGHCVAAIDAINLLVGNMSEAHADRYDRTDAGLSRFVTDFYSYSIGSNGMPKSPLGSHVNANTAGGLLEGGYLGFAELLWPHLPVVGERLVAFLSDGAFEEQRGSDWAPRWWRPEDCGLVTPLMILNGRRIEQRTQIGQAGGERWLHQHLRLHGFKPIGLDGRDPASFVWGILTIERDLAACAARAHTNPGEPVRLGYGIAEAPKGYGFPGAGTNRAHNLPLPGNPSNDDASRQLFNTATRTLWVAPDELDASLRVFQSHERQRRPLERDNPIARRRVQAPRLPEPIWRSPNGDLESPMVGLDEYFLACVEANPQLRPRVGNPDELRSNRMDRTLDALKHRSASPEPAVAESTTGAVFTALNEEAVVCAALGNKAGINVVVTYEAFGMKMLGALRQEIIFSRQQAMAGHSPQWLSVPLVLTSHTWENAKNEQSHQDPSLSEALLGEMSDRARVIFPADINSAMAALRSVYESRGQIAALVVPKRDLPPTLSAKMAVRLVREAAVVIDGDPERSSLLLAATGAYQLEAIRRAARRMRERGCPTAILYIAEPGRLRTPRDDIEASVVVDERSLSQLFPPTVPRVFLTHTRPEPYLGLLRRIDTGPTSTRALGYRNRGGTLDVSGLLFANGCTWAHVVAAAADVLVEKLAVFLDDNELAALAGRGDPQTILHKN